MMQPAIAHFREPYAWLIRGLLSKNWEDLSLSPNTFPMRSGFGFSVDNFLQTGGQFGLKILLLARDDNGWFDRDGCYEFYARHCIDHWNVHQFLVYSKDTGYFEFFPIQEDSLNWIGEQINDELLQHLRNFVPGRRQNKVISPAELSQIPDPKPILASTEFVQFLERRVRNNLDLNTAYHEGLILRPPPTQPAPMTKGQIQGQPRSPDPVKMKAQPTAPSRAQNRGMGISLGMGVGNQQAGGQQGMSFVGNTQTIAIDKLAKAAVALRIVFFLGIAAGLLALGNAGATIFMISKGMIARETGEYMLPIIGSMGISVFCLGGAVFSHFGLFYYREAREHPLAYAPIVYALLVPFCNFMGGAVVALWALWLWTRPEVKAARKK